MAEQKHILLIEDNPTDAYLIKELLSDFKKEFELEIVETLELGLHRLLDLRNPIEIVLLDLTLPDCQGIGTFEKVLEI